MTSTSATTATLLNRITPSQVTFEMKDPVDPTALVQAKEIIAQLRSTASGPVDAARLLAVAHKFGDIPSSQASYVISPEQCKEAFDSLPWEEKQALVQIHNRIQLFAQAQRRSVVDMEMDIPGGKAGHTVQPCRGTQSLSLFLKYIYIPKDPYKGTFTTFNIFLHPFFNF